VGREQPAACVRAGPRAGELSVARHRRLLDVPHLAALLGDAFRYGVDPNRAALEAILRYAAAQGFTSAPLEPADVFLPSTLTDAKV
jgi:hypothetical protein